MSLDDEYVFTRAPQADLVWITHPDTGGTAQIHINALPGWTGLGWEVCDAPPEPDPTRAHLIGLPPATPAPEPSAAVADPAADPKSKKSGTSGATPEKGAEQ